jgi:hypothetical protein
MRLLPGLFTRQETVACYHCGEQVALRHLVRGMFDGEQRDLCCHGCEAVLRMIESNGLTGEYLQNKVTQPHLRSS